MTPHEYCIEHSMRAPPFTIDFRAAHAKNMEDPVYGKLTEKEVEIVDTKAGIYSFVVSAGVVSSG